MREAATRKMTETEKILAMSKVYFGFAVADGMFPPNCTSVRKPLTEEEVRAAIAEGVTSCCNGSHKATVDAMRLRYGFDVAIPATPPHVLLQSGDSMLVMSVRGLARLTEDRHYTAEEVANATFVFGLWTVA